MLGCSQQRTAGTRYSVRDAGVVVHCKHISPEDWNILPVKEMIGWALRFPQNPWSTNGEFRPTGLSHFTAKYQVELPNGYLMFDADQAPAARAH